MPGSRWLFSGPPMPFHFDPATAIGTAAGFGTLVGLIHAGVKWYDERVEQRVEKRHADEKKRLEQEQEAENIRETLPAHERQLAALNTTVQKGFLAVEERAEAQAKQLEALATGQQEQCKKLDTLSSTVGEHIDDDRKLFAKWDERFQANGVPLAAIKSGERPAARRRKAPSIDPQELS